MLLNGVLRRLTADASFLVEGSNKASGPSSLWLLPKHRSGGPMLLTAVGAVSGVAPGRADTLERALVQAYQNNPSLNAQRAALRATHENVPQAPSGYQPKLSVNAAGGHNYFCEVNKAANHRQSAGCRCSDWGLTS